MSDWARRLDELDAKTSPDAIPNVPPEVVDNVIVALASNLIQLLLGDKEGDEALKASTEKYIRTFLNPSSIRLAEVMLAAASIKTGFLNNSRITPSKATIETVKTLGDDFVATVKFFQKYTANLVTAIRLFKLMEEKAKIPTIAMKGRIKDAIAWKMSLPGAVDEPRDDISDRWVLYHHIYARYIKTAEEFKKEMANTKAVHRVGATVAYLIDLFSEGVIGTLAMTQPDLAKVDLEMLKPVLDVICAVDEIKTMFQGNARITHAWVQYVEAQALLSG